MSRNIVRDQTTTSKDKGTGYFSKPNWRFRPIDLPPRGKGDRLLFASSVAMKNQSVPFLAGDRKVQGQACISECNSGDTILIS